jgi:hypothetical protein
MLKISGLVAYNDFYRWSNCEHHELLFGGIMNFKRRKWEGFLTLVHFEYSVGGLKFVQKCSNSVVW